MSNIPAAILGRLKAPVSTDVPELWEKQTIEITEDEYMTLNTGMSADFNAGTFTAILIDLDWRQFRQQPFEATFSFWKLP